MGKDSKIAWTHHTLNPWVGCTKVSAGCKHCYAEVYDRRVRGVLGLNKPRRWGPGAKRERTSPSNWKQPLKWNAAAKAAGERHRVFCASLADVFDEHESIPPQWRVDLFDLIRRTPHLDWLLLTKRPQNIRPLIEQAARLAEDLAPRVPGEALDATAVMLREWMRFSTTPSNIWLGTTVENKEQAKLRIPELLKVPAAVRFLSCEPLLERIDLREWIAHTPVVAAGHCMRCGQVSGAHIHNQPLFRVGSSSLDWVIVGGESGAGARPFNNAWARELRDQCAAAGVACFVKQLGAVPRDDSSDIWLVNPAHPDGKERVLFLDDSKGGDPSEWPADLRVRQFPEVRVG
jgi:protein gp37